MHTGNATLVAQLIEKGHIKSNDVATAMKRVDRGLYTAQLPYMDW